MLCFKSIYVVAAFVYNYTSNIKNKVLLYWQQISAYCDNIWFETNIDLLPAQSNNFSKEQAGAKYFGLLQVIGELHAHIIF